MKKLLDISFLFLAVLLAACTDEYTDLLPQQQAGVREIAGIRAEIEGGSRGVTRAGTVTPLADYVGRSEFVSGDRAVFTMIRRSQIPFDDFTYSGIAFNAGEEGGWSRATDDGGPERIYWTDATSPHTFIAYSIPQSYGEYWKPYRFETTEDGKMVQKTYYVGAIGNPTSTTGTAAIIDYYIDPYEKETVEVPNLDKDGNPILDGEGNPTTKTQQQYKYRSLVNNDSVFTNPRLEHEDVVIAYDDEMQAEPGGSVALVKFHHALSSIRVVVNISGFAATAADQAALVSDMRLLHQPTMYIWMQSGWGAQPLRAYKEGTVTNDQYIVDAAWSGNSTIPAYDQRKDIKLWIPKPEGSGSNQSKTFTFYGITTPQPQNYMSTLKEQGDTENTKTVLQFKVTYPDPMNPKEKTVTRDYTASLDDVYYEAGYNTTINISLNHRDEKMTVGAEYENWQFVATPDQGVLKKNSTFLQDTDYDGEDASVEHPNVTIVGDKKATADDATWLYESPTDSKIYDIYGHDGSTEAQAYQISTAYQLVSFAYEVKNGRTFEGKYVRLDADITLQTSSDMVKEEYVLNGDNTSAYDNALNALPWIGIGDADNAFDGIFLGGHRFIYRLYGRPLFLNLGTNAKVKQLNVSAINIGNGSSMAVNGGGLFAETSEGRISGCRVVGDVSLSGLIVDGKTYAGAFVGRNAGALYASYHIGDTESGGIEHVGGLVGYNDNGIISSCYQAGVVSGGTDTNRGIAGDYRTGDNIYNTYFNSSLFTYSNPSAHVVPKTSAEMTKQQFVDELNEGLAIWRTNLDETVVVDGTTVKVTENGVEVEAKGLGHTDYDPYVYVHQPANYPRLND